MARTLVGIITVRTLGSRGGGEGDSIERGTKISEEGEGGKVKKETALPATWIAPRGPVRCSISTIP